MQHIFGKWTLTAAFVFTLCLSMLVMSGTVLADELCVDCTNNGDGTVTDNTTGLMWQKNAPRQSMNWYESRSYASELSLGGHTDWRLPSRVELLELYNSPCKSIFDMKSLPNYSTAYWSSTTYPGQGQIYAWFVWFNNGSDYGEAKSRDLYVRVVRNAQ